MNDQEFLIDGFKFAAVSAGVKKADSDRLDFALISSETPAVTVGVTTTNLVCAAPVTLTRDRLQAGFSQAILMNSGNANAYTGEAGISDAQSLASILAERLGVRADLIIPMSTGVIGQRLPVDRMAPRIPQLVSSLDKSSFLKVASAIMTTDTVLKTSICEKTLSNGPLKILGMAKGAGMIAPNMATMLAVILVDVRIERTYLHEVFSRINNVTFNRVTVDGDTSTNDTAVVLSGGSNRSRVLLDNMSDRTIFYDALFEVCSSLAKQIVRDGEGASKLVEIKVLGAPDEPSAVKVSRRIAESPLVKTAFHGEDPNWGRIVCAAGSAGVSFDPSNIDLWIGSVQIVKSGVLKSDDWEIRAKRVMENPEFSVLIDLKAGTSEASIFTCDLSADYVGINADYRS
ncbi:MAG: bifunctional glutamate N-acetyltransferase/amino-acid acetyltransferase ArgJ [Desulfomonilaceae bacterium]